MNEWPWNRLWVQLSLSFSVLVIVAAAIFLFTFFIFRPEPPERRPPEGPPPVEQLDALPSDNPPPDLRNRAQEFITRTFITLSVIGAILGVLAGIWMGRRLALPLEELSETARAIGAHNLSVRATERGSYEMASLARSFNQMAEDLETAERLRQSLLSDVAHELRTPLTVVQSNLRAMLDDVYPLDKEEVARLYEQTRHLGRMVSDLHVLSQAEAHQLPLNLVTVDARNIIRDAGDIFEPVALENEITLTAEVPAMPVMLAADPARITQVVHNLLANALRHTPTGGSIQISLTDALSESPEGGRIVRIDVSDTGTGIAVDQINQVFDRFYRTDPARARDDGGAGLGLAISRALVEAHGGTIGVTSDGLGHGSTFTITLPGATGANGESTVNVPERPVT